MQVYSIVTAALLGAVSVAGGSNAAIVASYESSVSPTAGTTGAADPTTQGWAINNNLTNSYVSGQDSTLGGWRVTDGSNTAGSFYFYQKDLAVGDAADMAANDWTATWTVAVSRDAVSSAGVPNGVNNYYNATNQINNSMWIEVAGSFRYILSHRTDANFDIVIHDGTNPFQVTTDGNNLSEELGDGAPIANFVTFTLSYDAGTRDATLSDDQGNNHGVISTSGAAGVNRVVWGAIGSGNQGAGVWNNIEIDVVPEPGSLALLGLGGLLIARRRRG